LSLNPDSVQGGVSSLGTVTLNGPAPGGGIKVSLSDNSSYTTVPASVTVPSGSSNASFLITTTTVASNRSATISAVYARVTKTAVLTVTPTATASVSGNITPALTGSGTTVTLKQGSTTVATATADANGAYTFPAVANGTYTITPAKSGYTFSPASTSVTMNGVNVTGVSFTAVGLSMDITTYKDNSTFAASVASPAFTTRAGGELLLAFVSAAAFDTTPNVTSVSGGGLTWTLVQRANGQLSTAEIWKAVAAAPLTNATVTASLSQSSAATITLVAFAGVNPTSPVGAAGGGYAASGAPSAALTTQGANSWVFGVGTAWDHATARALGPNQAMVHQNLDPNDYTAWVQRQNATVQPAGTVVTINDTAPTGDRWNFSVVEIRQ
jgi:hypothetical protein